MVRGGVQVGHSREGRDNVFVNNPLAWEWHYASEYSDFHFGLYMQNMRRASAFDDSFVTFLSTLPKECFFYDDVSEERRLRLHSGRAPILTPWAMGTIGDGYHGRV